MELEADSIPAWRQMLMEQDPGFGRVILIEEGTPEWPSFVELLRG